MNDKYHFALKIEKLDSDHHHISDSKVIKNLVEVTLVQIQIVGIVCPF